MKNIHILSTDKPSRIYTCGSALYMNKVALEHNTNRNIYITSDEEIKEGDWVYYLHNSGLHEPRIMKVIKPNYSDYKPYSIHFKSGFGVQEDCKKIILTTDQDLIKDGVQAIDNEFLEWFVKNPSCEEIEIKLVEQRSHLSLNDWVDEDENGKFPISIAGAFCYRKIYKIIIPKEEPKQDLEKEMFDLEQELDIPSNLRFHNSKPKQETLEEAAEKYDENNTNDEYGKSYRAFIEGAKWQAERSYSEEEVLKLLISKEENTKDSTKYNGVEYITPEEWLEQFKKK